MIIDDIQDFLLEVQKPGRYVGGEPNCVIKNLDNVDIRFAFCFPDTYEIGMSHLGMKILYSLYNEIEGVWCERVFAPWDDMEQKMIENDIPLYALESGDPIKGFDFIGFTLQYELSYSNVLNMLKLAKVPLLSKERDDSCPIIICGGPCSCNPEPIADFVDIFVIGEGEEISCELFDLYKECATKKEFLIRAASLEGIYVPAFYDVSYNEDGTIASFTPESHAPQVIKKRIIKDMEKSYFPENFVVPLIEIVHDRAVSEVFRGCIRGCRFCQAGFIYRPVREKGFETVSRQSRALCENTGYDEISLSSLSTSDYTQIQPLLNDMLKWSEDQRVSVSLPSLRVDGFSPELMDKLNKLRKSGLTFAPEAGTQRLRDAINKNVTEEELLETCKTAYSGGWTGVKLYFMTGLPTESDEDIEGIANLGQKVVNTFYQMENKPKGKGVSVTVSASCFVPKPFTPFQWEAQSTIDELINKQKLLISTVKTKKISLKWHDAKTSFLEGVFARGDRRLGKVLFKAHELGCKFDGWSDFFDFEKWMQAFEECGVDPLFYTSRVRKSDEILPWDHLDYGVSKKYLLQEREKAYSSQTTPHCRLKCGNCGANNLTGGGACSAANKNSV